MYLIAVRLETNKEMMEYKNDFARYWKSIKYIIWERDNWTCAYCGLYMKDLYQDWLDGKIKRKQALLSIDHIIPKQQGEPWRDSSKENLITSCSICNNKKGGRNPKTQKL